MIKSLISALIMLFAWASLAFAAVDINSANEAELDKIHGVGPVKAKAIVEERKKNGPFKSLDDVATRVKGIGDKTVAAWKKSGDVTIGGGAAPSKAAAAKTAPPAPAATPAPAPGKTKAEAPKADAKKAEPAKADAKKAEPTKAEPKKAEPAKADAKKAEPKKTDKKEDKK